MNFTLFKRNNQIVNLPRFLNRLSELPDDSYFVEIKPAGNRTNTQNNYYWQILGEYIQPGLYNLGYRMITTKELAHEFCRTLFLKKDIVNENTGEVGGFIIESTSNLSKQQFTQYVENIIQMAAEYLGISIPEPNQQIEL